MNLTHAMMWDEKAKVFRCRWGACSLEVTWDQMKDVGYHPTKEHVGIWPSIPRWRREGISIAWSLRGGCGRKLMWFGIGRTSAKHARRFNMEVEEVKDWSKREYKPRVVNEHAEMEFAIEFPNTRNPWGQNKELDALIKQSQSDSPGLDRTFLGVRVERCTVDTCIQMLANENASRDTVVLVARTLHPDAGNWVWDERAVIEHVKGGWLVTLLHFEGNNG